MARSGQASPDLGRISLAGSPASPASTKVVQGPPDRMIRRRPMADRHHPRRHLHARAGNSSSWGFAGEKLTEVIEAIRGRESVAAWSGMAGAGSVLACRGWGCTRAPPVSERLRRWRHRPRLTWKQNKGEVSSR
jgi:hypothetical protein